MTGTVKVPKQRMGVLIGNKGENKKRLETELGAEINISDEGEVEYYSDDALNMLKLGNIIKAIARGFSVDTALMLLDDEYTFELLDIEDFSGENKNSVARCKARVIGTDGSIKSRIEILTKTDIVIYGKTIGIIGKFDDVFQAKESLERLLAGSTHKNVMEYLERWASSRNMEKM